MHCLGLAFHGQLSCCVPRRFARNLATTAVRWPNPIESFTPILLPYLLISAPQRIATPEEVAHAITFLLHPQTTFTTGERVQALVEAG